MTNSTSEYVASSKREPTESRRSLGTVRSGVGETSDGAAGEDVIMHVIRKAS